MGKTWTERDNNRENKQIEIEGADKESKKQR